MFNPWINAQLGLTNDQKRSIHHTWKHALVPGKVVMLWNIKHCSISSNAEKKRGFPISTNPSWQSHKEKEVKPGTAASCSTSRQTTRWDLKKANCYTLLRWITWLKTVNSDSDRQFLLRKVFPEGLMSSCRIRHEPHTCSDLSYQILMWNASVVQKNFNLHLTGRFGVEWKENSFVATLKNRIKSIETRKNPTI